MRKHLLVVLLFATSISAADLPKYWAVHIDYAADRAAYEKIEMEFSTALKDFYDSHHVTPPTVISFSTPDGVYYGLRPRGTFTDFDQPNRLGDSAKELQARLAPISAATHATLKTHNNEIWQVDNQLTSLRGESAPKYLLLRTDSVTPPNDEAYGKAMKQLRDELVARNIGVLAFFSAYGDGSYRYLFMSDQPLNVRTVGKLAKTIDTTAKPRPDFHFVEPAHWLHVMSSASETSGRRGGATVPR